MDKNISLFLDNLQKESDSKYTAIKNLVVVKSGQDLMSADAGVESFDSIVSFFSDMTEFIFDNYKALLDWIATTEVVIDKVTYKTRQNNIRYLQTLNKDNKDLNKIISYQEVKDFNVPTITGLKCDLKTFNKAMAGNIHFTNILEELVFLREFAESVIENNGFTKDKRGTLFIDINTLNNRIKVNTGLVDSIKKDLQTVTDGDSVTDIRPISKLVKSLNDLEKETADTIKVGKFYTVEKIEKLNKLYKETNSKVEEMLNIMEISEDSKITHDGKSIAVMARYVHSVAELLSFVSMKFFYYSLLVDTEVALHSGLKDYKETKDSTSFNNVVASFLNGIENAISSLTKLFK